MLAPKNTAFGAKNHSFGQNMWTMPSRCRGAVGSHSEIANKGDDILGFTLDPAHLGGDEKGLQDSVPAMNLWLSIKPNNQHLCASGEVLYTQADTMKIKLLKLCHQAEAPLYLLYQYSNGLLKLQMLVLALVLLENHMIIT